MTLTGITLCGRKDPCDTIQHNVLRGRIILLCCEQALIISLPDIKDLKWVMAHYTRCRVTDRCNLLLRSVFLLKV
jgi:hypothetical protein